MGIGTDRQTYELIEKAKGQETLKFSHTETKEEFSNTVTDEMEKSEDRVEVDEGVQKFIEWIRNSKNDEGRKIMDILGHR